MSNWRSVAARVRGRNGGGDNRDNRDKTASAPPNVPIGPNVPVSHSRVVARCRVWRDDLMSVDPYKPRAGFSSRDWYRLLDDADWLYEAHAETLAGAGWGVGDLERMAARSEVAAAPAEARAPVAGESAAMAAEPGASISQEVRQPDYLFPERPSPINGPLTEAQIRAGDIQPRDVVPLPSNEVGSVEEAAAIDKGRFAPATAPNERGELTRQTLRAWRRRTLLARWKRLPRRQSAGLLAR